jgi:RNA methyltransferase, TrmH family
VTTAASEVIRSAANPLVRRARRLRQKRYRHAEGAFVAEGIHPVWEALERGADIEAILVCDELLTSEPARARVARAEAEGTRVAHLASATFGSVAEREHPSGLAAIVRMETCDVADLDVNGRSLFVGLHEIGNPGNLGTILRTVDAVGGAGVVLVGDATDPWHPVAVKASMGTLFSVRACRARDTDELLAWCRTLGLQVITTSPHAETPYLDAPYRLPALALFGSEGEGLPDETRHAGDLSVSIPMGGSASSLNLAVSVGVMLYEIRRVVGS